MSSIFNIANGLLGGSTGKSESRSTSESSSGNLAYPGLSAALNPQVANASKSSNSMADLLGLNGGPAQNAGFDQWRNSTGYQFGLNQGTQAITGSAAAKGLLNSGSTAKALQQYGTDYANTKFGDYFGQLTGLGNMGNNAAGVISDAGKVSNSTLNSTSFDNRSNGPSGGGSLGSMIGSLLTK